MSKSETKFAALLQEPMERRCPGAQTEAAARALSRKAWLSSWPPMTARKRRPKEHALLTQPRDQARAELLMEKSP